MYIAFLDYFIIGIFGYITFVNNPIQFASANILLGAYNNNAVITVGSVALIFANIFGMPLLIKPAKDSFRDMLFDYSEKKESFSGEVVVNEESTLTHFILITLVTFSQMLAGMYCTSLATFANIVGGIVTPIICFIIPCIFYLKLEVGSIYSRKKIFCFIVFIASIGYTIYAALKFL